jgi:hypothetical protein
MPNNLCRFFFVISIVLCASTSYAYDEREIAAKNDFEKKYGQTILEENWKFLTYDVTMAHLLGNIYVQGEKIREGGIRSVWILMSTYEVVGAFLEPAYQSTKSQIWINCKDGSIQVRESHRYSDPLGHNKNIVDSVFDVSIPNSQPTNLTDPPPGSIAERIVKQVCP